MIKKTFKTLGENPIILLGFALPVIVSFLAVLPMFPVLGRVGDFIVEYVVTGVTPAPEAFIGMIGSSTAAAGLLSLASLLITIFILPPVMNKVYDACSNNGEPGWYARGLKRSWWKVIVTSMIYSAIASGVMFVAAFFMMIPRLGGVLYMLASLVIAIFGIIIFTSVIAEDQYGRGLGNAFSVGQKYFFKQLGALLLAALPIILIALIMFFSVVSSIAPYATSPDPQKLLGEIVGDMLGFAGALAIVFSVYYIFASAFVYTYSMNQYLDLRTVPFDPSTFKKDGTLSGFDQYENKYNAQHSTPSDSETTKSGTKTQSGNLDNY